MLNRMQDWGYQQGRKQIADKIHKIVKKKRLKFLDDNRLIYIDKDQIPREWDFNRAASQFIVIGGWDSQMLTLGLTVDDVKTIIVEEYKKQKGVK